MKTLVPKNLRPAFGARVRIARERMELKQVALAMLLNTTHSAITHWETGHRAPSRANLAALAIVLQVSVRWLLHGDEGL